MPPPASPYKPKDCPPPDAMAKQLDEWAKYWYEWGTKVHERLWPEGNTTNPDPPPPPPFGGDR